MTVYRLYRFYRQSGFPFLYSIKRAIKVWRM